MTREDFAGKRVAIAGLGVSGIAAAKALQALGATAVVYDQKQSDNPSVIDATDELMRSDISVVTSWHGHLDPSLHDILVVSPGFREDHPAIGDMQGKPILGEIELAYSIALAPILAITGTNGKSTTTVLLWELIKAAGFKARLCGNIAGSGYPEEVLTTAAMSAGADEVLVAEISSFQLEFADQFRPRVAAITNVTPDHMDRHPSFRHYFETKMRLVRRQGEGDTIVLNIDGTTVTPTDIAEFAGNGARLVTYSSSGTNPTLNSVTSREGNTLILGSGELHIDDLKVPGEHNISNIMMAWEMAHAMGDPGTAGIEALKKFTGLANRLEFLGERDGVKVYNNSMCTNPAAVINSSRSFTTRQHILMGGNTKGLEFSPVARYLVESGNQVYLFGNDQKSLNTMLGGQWPEYNSLQEAFDVAVSKAQPGQIVILSPGCASSEPYANFKERGIAFKQIAKDWLENGTRTRT